MLQAAEDEEQGNSDSVQNETKDGDEGTELKYKEVINGNGFEELEQQKLGEEDLCRSIARKKGVSDSEACVESEMPEKMKVKQPNGPVTTLERRIANRSDKPQPPPEPPDSSSPVTALPEPKPPDVVLLATTEEVVPSLKRSSNNIQVVAVEKIQETGNRVAPIPSRAVAFPESESHQPATVLPEPEPPDTGQHAANLPRRVPPPKPPDPPGSARSAAALPNPEPPVNSALGVLEDEAPLLRRSEGEDRTKEASIVWDFLDQPRAEWVLSGFGNFLNLMGQAHTFGLNVDRCLMFLQVTPDVDKVRFGACEKRTSEDASQVATDSVGSLKARASFFAEEEIMVLYIKEKGECPMKISIRQGLVNGTRFGVSFFLLFSVYVIISFYAKAKFVEADKASCSDVFKATEVLSQSSSLAPGYCKANITTASIFEIIDSKSKMETSEEACQITLGRIEDQHLQLKWLRQQMGLVSQEPVLFNDTILANIADGQGGHAAEVDSLCAGEFYRNSKKEVAKHYIEFWSRIPSYEPCRVVLGVINEYSRFVLALGYSDFPIFIKAEEFLDSFEVSCRALCAWGDQAIAEGSLLELLRQESDQNTDVMTVITKFFEICSYTQTVRTASVLVVCIDGSMCAAVFQLRSALSLCFQEWDPGGGKHSLYRSYNSASAVFQDIELKVWFFGLLSCKVSFLISALRTRLFFKRWVVLGTGLGLSPTNGLSREVRNDGLMWQLVEGWKEVIKGNVKEEKLPFRIFSVRTFRVWAEREMSLL